MTAEAFAPAKINLALHVLGQRADGYHLLDSLVMFANVGDRLITRAAERVTLKLTGPMAEGVPTGPDNLVLKAAAWAGREAAFELEKHLPAAAGLGGGSSDAAAALRALEALGGPIDGDLGALGADLPVCAYGRACLMRGIGEDITPVEDLPRLAAVLANPRVPVSTPRVFDALESKENAPMPRLPPAPDLAAFIGFLDKHTRNDLEAPARGLAREIGEALDRLWSLQGARLARMSGSGASCFALFDDWHAAQEAAAELRAARPDWWVTSAWLS